MTPISAPLARPDEDGEEEAEAEADADAEVASEGVDVLTMLVADEDEECKDVNVDGMLVIVADEDKDEDIDVKAVVVERKLEASAQSNWQPYSTKQLLKYVG